MPRRARIVRRAIAPDALYQNVMVQRVINKILQDGKKSVAERIVYGSLKMIEEQTNRDPIETFELAMRNVTPLLEVRPRRVGGATYQVPMEIQGESSRFPGYSLVGGSR